MNIFNREITREQIQIAIMLGVPAFGLLTLFTGAVILGGLHGLGISLCVLGGIVLLATLIVVLGNA